MGGGGSGGGVVQVGVHLEVCRFVEVLWKDGKAFWAFIKTSPSSNSCSMLLCMVPANIIGFVSLYGVIF